MPVSWEDRNVKLYSQTELDQAVAQERAACAKIASDVADGHADNAAAWETAVEIRQMILTRDNTAQ